MAEGEAESRAHWILPTLGVVTVLGGLVRFLMAGWYLHLNQDAAYLFLPCAQHLTSGDWGAGLDHSVPTGFLVIHALWLWLLPGEPEFVARLLTVLLGTACVPVVYLLARRFVTAPAALLAAAAMAFNPKSVEYSGRVSSEVPYAFFLVVATLVGIVAIRRRGLLWPALAGIAIGVAYLIRPEGMVLLPVVGLGCVVATFRQDGKLASVGPLVAGALGFILAALPMIWVNYEATGRVSLSNKGGISLERREDTPRELALTDDHTSTLIRHYLSREGYRSFSLTDHVLGDPLGFAGRWLYRLGWFLGRYLPRVMGVAIIVGVLATLFLAWRHGLSGAERGLLLYLGGTIALYLAALAVFFMSDRFVLPMVPILAVIAAPGLLGLSRWLESQRVMLGTAVLVAVVGADAAGSIRKLDKYDGWTLGWRSNPLAAIGAEIGSRFGAKRILSPGGEIAYYAGAEAVIFPNDEYSAVLDYARHQKAELIVYSRSHRPDRPDSIRSHIRDWPDEPAGLEALGEIRHETPLGPVSVSVWRVLPEKP